MNDITIVNNKSLNELDYKTLREIIDKCNKTVKQEANFFDYYKQKR